MVRQPNTSPKLVATRAPGPHAKSAQHEYFGPAVQQHKPVYARCPCPQECIATKGDCPHAAQQALLQAKARGIDLNKLPGQQLKTTHDAALEQYAQQALRRQFREICGRNASDGAVLVLDNDSGKDLSVAPEVDGVLALRQTGSTLKPFLYAQAFALKLLTPASLLQRRFPPCQGCMPRE